MVKKEELSNREKARRIQSDNEKKSKRNRLIAQLSVVGAAILVIVGIVLLIVNRESIEDIDFSVGSSPAVANEAGGIVLTNNDEIDAPDEELGEVNVEALPSHSEPYGVSERVEGEKPHIIIYTDPACPYCNQFEAMNHEFIDNMLSQELITVDHRYIAFLDQSSQRFSSRASNAFMCMADESPENYYEYSAGILSAGDHSLSSDNFIDIAENEYGVDIADCVDNNDYRALVAYNTNLASQSGITGTPTVYVDDINWMDSGEEFEDLVNASVAEYEQEQD